MTRQRPFAFWLIFVRQTLLLGALFLATSCRELSSYAVPTTAAQLPPRVGPVAIFASRTPPNGQDLGIVEARGAGDERDIRVLFPELVRRVQQLGGNGLVLDATSAHYQVIPTWMYGSLSYRCGWGGPCNRWDTYPSNFETMSVVLRGRAFLLSPSQLDGSAP